MSAGFDQFFQTDNTAGINQGGFSSKGDLILNPAYKASYYGAGWGDGKVTTIRILPFFDKSAAGWPEVPYRGGAGFTKFSPWFRSYPAFRSIGQTGKATILVNDPYKNKLFDQNANPICVLYNEISKAAAYGPKNRGELPGGRRFPHTGSNMVPPYWYDITKGSANKGADLPYLSSVVLVTALIYQHPSKKDGLNGLPIGLRDEDGCIVFEFTGPFWEKTISPMLNEVRPGATPGDFENYYAVGDPVSLQHGRFLHIFKDGCDPRGGATMNQPSLDIYNQTSQQSKEKFVAKGYACFFTRTLPGYPDDNGQLTARLQYDDLNWKQQVEQKIKERWVPLDDLISVPDNAQQIQAVSNLFPAEMLIYAWENHPQWISDELRAKAAVTNVAPPINISTPPGYNPIGPVGGMPAAGIPSAGMPGGFAPPASGAVVPPYQPSPMPAASVYPPAPPQAAPVYPPAPPQAAPAYPPVPQTAPVAAAPVIPPPVFMPTTPQAAPAATPDSAVSGLGSADFPPQPGAMPPVQPAAIPLPQGLSNLEQLKNLASQAK